MINEPTQTENQPLPGAERVPTELLIVAAERIVPASGNRRDLAARFLAGAAASGLDLSHTFAVFDRDGPSPLRARQACFAIPGPGRTAMLFLSQPAPAESDVDQQDRDACVRASIRSLRDTTVTLVQALPDPAERWACDTFERAGMKAVGDLAYMSRPLPGRRLAGAAPPTGVRLRPVDSMNPDSADRTLLTATLDRTYEGTLDCPELCGLRSVEDVLDSHLAAGVFTPRHWLLALEGDRCLGCSLVSETDDGSTAELVYIGLVPEARGRGLARALLESSILGLRATKAQRLVCAVDRRNTPAARLYASLDFREFAARRAWVLPL